MADRPNQIVNANGITLRERLQSLVSWKSIPAWLILVIEALRGIRASLDYASLGDFIWGISGNPHVKLVLTFLSSPLGTLLVFAVGFGWLAYLIVRPERKTREASPLAESKPALADPLTPSESPDTWLHELADAQSKEIRAWLRLECESCRPETSDLSRTKPYIDFRIVVCNYSVFKASLTQLHGIINYHGQPLSGAVHWVSNGITRLPPGERADAVIRLLLDDPADLLRLRNVDSVFTLDNLKARIETEPPTEIKDLSLNCPGLDIGRIRAQYPKLKMEIASVGIKGYFENPGDHLETLGSVVNVKLALENTRNTPLVIEEFKLITLIDGRHIVAQIGEMRELPVLVQGQIQQTGNQLGNNLNQCPLRAEPRDSSLQGWLQFIVRDVTTLRIRGTGATVIAIDSTGELHPISFNLPAT